MFLKQISKNVILSEVPLSNTFYIEFSTKILEYSCRLYTADYPDYAVSQILLMTYSLLIFSKTPSHPTTMKSKYFSILNSLISGMAMVTLGFPPYFLNLHSMSPNVRHTDSLPGRTLNGPYNYCTCPFLLF